MVRKKLTFTTFPGEHNRLYWGLCEKLKQLKYIFKSFKPLRGLRKIKI
jgi:hypothetical protein